MDADGFMAEMIEAAVRHRLGENRIAEAADLEQQVEHLVPARSDLTLLHIQLRSDLTKDRAATRVALANLLEHGQAPPTVATAAIMMLAYDAASRGDYQMERSLLLKALVRAPKNAVGDVFNGLASCHRSLHDFRGARRYAEIAVALVPQGSPALVDALYNLAIYQKNDHDIETALVTLQRAQEMNAESWNVQMLEAGYTVLAGRRDEGIRLRSLIVPPRDNLEFWLCMTAWFLAVLGEHDQFLDAFETALASSNTQNILVWVAQDVDLDPFREDPRFKSLLDQHRQRLATAPVPAPAR